MVKFGFGIAFGAILTMILTYLTGKDIFTCGIFILVSGILLASFSSAR